MTAGDQPDIRLQQMPVMDRVLAVTPIAESRSTARSFTSAMIRSILVDLGIPHPKNLSATLGFSEIAGHVMKVSRTGSIIEWRLTPVGRARADALLNELDRMELMAMTIGSAPPEFGGMPHPTVRPQFAPPTLHEKVIGFLHAHPFDQNVFGMTRFADDQSEDAVAAAVVSAKSACADHGLEFHLASDRALSDNLWENVAGHMWSSRYGIAFFEDRVDKNINYNVTIEVGAMLMTGRRCALLKDTSVDALPTDLVGHIYKEVDLASKDRVSETVHTWIREDLDLGRCTNC